MNKAVDTLFLEPSYRMGGVVLSVLVAAFASYVALDLARRVRTRDRLGATAWAIGGALVLGTGIWSMHFIGMLAFSLPIALGYAPFVTFLSWGAAVGVSALALSIASRERLTVSVVALGSTAMGGGICAMHYLGMAAMDIAPGIVWNPALVTASAAIACAASAAALLIFFGMRRFSRRAHVEAAQVVAALVMGAAISGMHYTGMAAAGFPVGSVCLSADGLGGQHLGTLVVLASVLLLSVTLFTSVFDARMQARANRLTASLQSANLQLRGANDELRRLAFIDPLTQVPNRTWLENRLIHAVADADRRRDGGEASRVGLLFIDLDGFKPVNDSYGHATGDALLEQVAQRLSQLARSSDSVARIGGDEFVLLVDDMDSADDAMAQAARVLAAIAKPFDLPGRRLSLSCSIGVAIYPDHGRLEQLVAHADAAMYSAKQAGGGRTAQFEADMQGGISSQLQIQQDLREALDAGALSLHYQPKIDVLSGRIRSVEALLRWTHPTRGPIGPAVFIPIAERCGLILPIGNWVIDEACRQIAAWADEGCRMRVSINLSRYQLRRPEMAAHLQQAMARHAIEPDQIVCEVTESMVMEDTGATQRVIADLLALGVKLSIDDFGTGYSSLASLRQLRAQELKIDRGFVKDVASCADARAVVDAVVHLAKALGLRVVAEGVETRAQRDVLIELGCDELQGFYFARPMPADALIRSGQLTSDGADSVAFAASTFID